MRMAFLGDASLDHVRRWAGYFDRRGHDVLLLSFEEAGDCAVTCRRVKRILPTKLLGCTAALGSIKSELEFFRPDLVNALYAGGYGFVAALSGFRPLVITTLGSDLLVDYPSSIIHRLQIDYAVRRAELITTDADVLTDVLVRAGVPPVKILKAHFGIDEDVFYPPREDLDSGQSAEARIISTRNLHPIYGVENLIAALPALIEHGDARAVICGDGPERERLERKAARLGLGERIEFRGRLGPGALADQLRSADVSVSTSLSDSTSVSLLEAMACGAPPVVTDIPANREWITDGENGLLVPPGDPLSLAGALRRILEDRAFASSIRALNRKLVMERGLWRENMETVERAFIRLAGTMGGDETPTGGE
jgi:glycosyltransferase involved in cell wall biosynthesis